MNSMANRGTGGGRIEMNRRHCTHHVRRSNTIIETLPRIIRGTCPKTLLLRNTAHVKIRSTLAGQETHCQSVASLKTQNKRADIIVIDRKKNRGFVFDPTIRRGTNIETQNDDISVEEQAVYVPGPQTGPDTTIPDR